MRGDTPEEPACKAAAPAWRRRARLDTGSPWRSTLDRRPTHESPGACEDTPISDEAISAALELHRDGRRAEAAAAYALILAADPDDPTALYLSGLCHGEMGRTEEAARQLERLRRLRPEVVEGHLALANLRHADDDHPAALEAYGVALALDPEREEAHVGRIASLRALGRLDEAVAAASDWSQRAPGSAAARLALGNARLAKGDLALAEGDFAEAVALQPDLIAARNGLALALMQQDRLEPALKALYVVLDLAPASEESWLYLGATLKRLGRHRDAVTALNRALALKPDLVGALVSLGNCYIELGRAEEAADALRRAIALDPRRADVHASLASFYVKSDQRELAEASARAALALDPGLVGAHQNLAALLEERGEAAEARRHRDEAYGRQNLFVHRTPDAELDVLILSTAGPGAVPYRDILPAGRFGQIVWIGEYARPGQAEALPPFDVVFNAVGDADLAAPALAPIQGFLAAPPKPVINNPAAVMRTHRHEVAASLAGIDGLVVPRTIRLDAQTARREGIAALVARAGLAPPLLLRPLGSHGGQGVVRVDGAEDLARAKAGEGDLYVTEFCDVRSADGWHRKYRTLFVDGRPFPYHLAISRHWLVHHGTADMSDDRARLEEELAFLADPAAAVGETAARAIAAVGARLGLDYFGVDYAVRPDGQAVLFEANATMLVHYEDAQGPFAGKNPAVAAICEAFQAMIRARAGR